MKFVSSFITPNYNAGFTHVSCYFSKEMGSALGYVNATTSKVESLLGWAHGLGFHIPGGPWRTWTTPFKSINLNGLFRKVPKSYIFIVG